MELRRLRYFAAVAEELHFGRAAQRLHMAQQPLSAQIRELEREIGHDLFERYANRIRLTPAGEVLLGEARAILQRSESAVALARRAASGETGVVRVGYCSAAMTEILPATIRSLKDAHPSLGLDLQERSQVEQLRALERDELDVGFAYRPFDDRTFDALDVAEERIVVAVPSDHRFAAMPRVPVELLAQEPLVLFPAERFPVLAQLTERIVDLRGRNDAAALHANDKATALGLVAHGLGVTFFPEHGAFPRGDITYVPLDTQARLRFAAVWSRLAPERLHRRHFLETLATIVERISCGRISEFVLDGAREA